MKETKKKKKTTTTKKVTPKKNMTREEVAPFKKPRITSMQADTSILMEKMAALEAAEAKLSKALEAYKQEMEENAQKEQEAEEIKTEKVVEESKKKTKIKRSNKFTYLINFLQIFIVTFLVEIIFRAISEYSIFSYETLRIFFSTIILSGIFAFISNIFKKRWISQTIIYVYVVFYTIYSWLHLGFLSYLGVYMSFNTSGQFGAVKDYIWDFLDSIPILYYLIYLPLIALIIVNIFYTRKLGYSRFKIKRLLYGIPALLVLCFCYYETLVIPFMQNSLQVKSNLKLFINPDVPTVAVSQFGTITFGLCDLRTYWFPVDETDDELLMFLDEKVDNSNVHRKVSPCLDEIAENDTSKYKTLNQYFANRRITDYNDYTGLFEGKNVIFILMESVNEAIIDEENFPNFYNLYTNGYHWVNNYSPRNSCATGNNEFSAMTSLYSIYNTCTSNTYKNNTYFESVFGLFNNKGYYTSSMHDFLEWYYKRSVFHINMGSQKYYGIKDLKMSTKGVYGDWPSDEVFFDKAADILIEQSKGSKPIMTWFTTVTSHQPYSVSSTYGDLYLKEFKSQGYSTIVSRYLSKLKVLDNALGVLIKKLDEAGILDNTVIVMTGDHYPYGLSNKFIKEIIHHDISNYDVEKTPFVIYNSSLEGKEFTEYTTYINILPTIANLFNLDYDPRLYMGEDLFSEDYTSLVVFADGSWKNEYAYYNASKSTVVCYDDKVCTTEYIKNMNILVRNKIDMSSKAIKSDYFNYLESQINKCLLTNKNEKSTKNTIYVKSKYDIIS